MKLCFSAKPQPMEEYFSFAKENGFPWIELSCNNPSNFLDKWTPARISSIKKLRDQADVKYGLHSNGKSLGPPPHMPRAVPSWRDRVRS